MIRNDVYYDLLVIGAGAAGISAALTAAGQGASVLLADRGNRPGGILNRCIHSGFRPESGLSDMTGTDCAALLRSRLAASSVTVCSETEVLSLRDDRSALLSSPEGLFRIRFRNGILAAGSSERTLESLPAAGTRPAGVFTAGCAQGLINEHGFDIGDRIVILGTGNVGQIMGRQLAAAGKEIVALVEQKEAPGGLVRTRRECIDAWHLPLRLHSTVTALHGSARLTGVTVQDLHSGESTLVPCDTLLTALGLIPDRTLLQPLLRSGRKPDWIRICGNCRRIYARIGGVVRDGERAAETIIPLR